MHHRGPRRMVIAESMYGSDRAGLVCGYVFQPGGPGRAIESDAAAGLSPRGRDGERVSLAAFQSHQRRIGPLAAGTRLAARQLFTTR